MNTLLCLLALSGAALAFPHPSADLTTQFHEMIRDPNVKKLELRVDGNLKTDSSLRGYGNYGWEDTLITVFKVGTPGKHFPIAVETGSPNIFFLDADYPDAEIYHFLYDAKNSSTSKLLPRKFKQSNAGLTVAGKTYSDEFDFGAGRTLTQSFGSVTELQSEDKFFLSGILGLGWAPGSAKTPGDEAPFVVNVLSHLNITSQAYTLYMAENSRGWLLFGVNPEQVPKYPAHAVNGQAAVTVDKVTVGNVALKNSHSAVIDTAYTTLALPEAEYNAVVEAVGAKFDDELGNLVVDCSEGTSRQTKLTFTVGGVDHSVRSHHYVIDRDYKGEKCVVAVSKSTDNVIHLGLPFARATAVVFGVGSDTIGLAQISR